MNGLQARADRLAHDDDRVAGASRAGTDDRKPSLAATEPRDGATMPIDPYFSHAEGRESGVLRGCFTRSTRLDTGDGQRVARAVARAKQGDREALRYLYVRFADNVYGYVASIVRDQHEAEDVTQQVFAKLMIVLPRYEQRGVPFSSWLLRLAHNAAIDHLRRRLALPVEEVRSATEVLDDRAAEGADAVGAALAALPDDQRKVVLLRHLVGLSPGEIAEHLGRSENAIHGLHHRGRRTLQRELRRLECGPVTVRDRERAAA